MLYFLWQQFLIFLTCNVLFSLTKIFCFPWLQCLIIPDCDILISLTTIFYFTWLKCLIFLTASFYFSWLDIDFYLFSGSRTFMQKTQGNNVSQFFFWKFKPIIQTNNVTLLYSYMHGLFHCDCQIIIFSSFLLFKNKLAMLKKCFEY